MFLINRLHRSSSLERSSRGGEKRTALCASQYEERGSDDAVSPPMCDRRVGFHRCGLQTWYNPSGAVVVTCRIATARTRRAERTVQGNVLSVWQVLHGTSSAPHIAAQRVARFDDHCTSNLFISRTLKVRGGIISQANRYLGGFCSSQRIFPPQIIQVLLINNK